MWDCTFHSIVDFIMLQVHFQCDGFISQCALKSSLSSGHKIVDKTISQDSGTSDLKLYPKILRKLYHMLKIFDICCYREQLVE
jgi:hypothetical protein